MHGAVDYSYGVCRMWDSASRKKLRNPLVYPPLPSLHPHCTIRGLFPEDELHAQQPLQEVERSLRGGEWKRELRENERVFYDLPLLL